jgi:hypothetical protein
VSRTIVVGDVHGCATELEALLERVAFATGDRLVLVGDLVARGPDSLGVLDIARRTGAVIVRGNHEDKLLRWHSRKLAHARGLGRRPEPLERTHAHVARKLRPVDWTLLGSSVLWDDLPEHDLRVVHAGVVPGVAIEDQPRRALLRMRTVGPKKTWSDEGAGTLWGEVYIGPPHVVFGHNARAEPQLHKWATGLDTGCVYGGRLTALVLREGERVPRGKDVRDLMVSERARRRYWGGKRGPLGDET